MKQIEHNPDVLNCIANLSNDEVFTAPALVNQMLDLLPQKLFSDPYSTFLDPFTKTAVFLREIVKRLDKGLEAIIPNRQERIDHILHKQVFGMAITELTSLLSRRTLYCSKFANGEHSISHFNTPEGNIWYQPMKHTWVNGKCKFCGAPQSVYDRGDDAEQYAYPFIHITDLKSIYNMKFSVICGNPPYHLSDGGGSNQISAKPIYNLFINQAKKLQPAYLSMIIPSRWFAGGKGLDDFRNTMINDRHIKNIIHYPKSRDCFQGVDIAGGVCYFLLDTNYDGDCTFTVKTGDYENRRVRSLNEFPVLVSDNIGIDIIHKVRKVSSSFLNERVLTRNSFGFTSSARGTNEAFEDCITLISSEGVSYVNRAQVTKNVNLVLNYKISVGTLNPDRGGVNNASDSKSNVTTKVRILNPNEVVTETYIVIDTFPDKKSAENFASYMRTKFVRYLISLTISSMHIVRDNFQFVPIPDCSHEWSDQALYKMYGLSQKECELIESQIRTME